MPTSSTSPYPPPISPSRSSLSCAMLLSATSHRPGACKTQHVDRSCSLGTRRTSLLVAVQPAPPRPARGCQACCGRKAAVRRLLDVSSEAWALVERERERTRIRPLRKREKFCQKRGGIARPAVRTRPGTAGRLTSVPWSGHMLRCWLDLRSLCARVRVSIDSEKDVDCLL